MRLGYRLSRQEWGHHELVAHACLASTIAAHEHADFDALYVNQIGPDQEGLFAADCDGVLSRART